MIARRSAGLPVVHWSQLNPCIRSQAMPCFSSITALALAKCECRSANGEVQLVRHSKFVIRLVALAAAPGVGDERLLELIGETEVIHHQPTVARRGLPV